MQIHRRKLLFLAIPLLAVVATLISIDVTKAKRKIAQRKFVPLTVLYQSENILSEQHSSISSLATSTSDGSSLYALDSQGNLTVNDGEQRKLRRVQFTTSPSQVKAVAVDVWGNIYLADSQSTMHVMTPNGQELKTFPVPEATSIAALSDGSLVVSSLVKGKLLHLYSPQGELRASFCEMKDYGYGEAQNEFLNRGKVVTGPDDSIYFVPRFAPIPTVQKFSDQGQQVLEFPIEGTAIDIQLEVANRFLNSKSNSAVGGFTIITSASVDTITGNLWVGMLGASHAGVIYEYNSQGEKLRESALVNENPKHSSVVITSVHDIVARGSSVYVITEGRALRFRLDNAEGSTPDVPRFVPAKYTKEKKTPRLNGTVASSHASWSPVPARVAALFLQASCTDTEQNWDSCTVNCAAGSVTETQDCRAALMNILNPIYKKLTYRCDTPSNGGADGRGSCRTEGTVCKNNVITTHQVELACRTPPPTPTPVPPPPAGTCNAGPTSSGGCATGLVLIGGRCQRSAAFQSRCNGPTGYEPETCSCPDGTNNSPIIVDVDHSGFSLTDAANGVDFDILALGYPQHVSWTALGSTNAFLALDGNGNDTIDDSTELFGNYSPQPEPPAGQERNGFLALAEHDKLQNGGNGDGMIDSNDTIFNSLRLWQDTNHNGVSENNELHTVPELGLRSIDLNYKSSRRTDQYGNQFRYRAKVRDMRGAQVGRWAWDVFLVIDQ